MNPSSGFPALVCIITVTWNGKKYVRQYLDSLREHGVFNFADVIVVDNASTDGTPELIQRDYPEVRLIRNAVNLGFAGANNTGIAQSCAKYVCLINSDVKVLEGCFETMISFMEHNPDVGVLGPRMLDVDGAPRRSYMGTPTLWNLLCRALGLDVLFPGSRVVSGWLMSYFRPDGSADVDILNGWFWMIRSSALSGTGLLDDTFFMYAEDMDWCTRFRRAGWRVVFMPQAAAIHYGGGSSSLAPVRFYVERQRANLQYWRKYHGMVSVAGYLGITALDQILRVAGYSLRYVARSKGRPEASHKIVRSLACLRWVFGLERGARKEVA